MSIKVSELTTQTPVSTDNLLLESGTHGTSKATIANIQNAGLEARGLKGFTGLGTAEAHNCLYRGKEWTVENLSTAVLANNFSDIYIGDYFYVSFTSTYGTVSDRKCYVAGINYFKNCGDTPLNSAHLVIVPAGRFGTAAMNSTNITTGGYAGSAMHTTVLPAIATSLKSAIGSSHVISHRRRLSNSVNNSTPSMAGGGSTGASTGSAWADCDLCLMTEPMVYGCHIYSSSCADICDGKQQLPLFALNPQLANIGVSYWLSGVCSSDSFTQVDSTGRANSAGPSNSVAVVPYFIFH